jgi:colanic acid/amylovoran biosynthesis glycosyltransferase
VSRIYNGLDLERFAYSDPPAGGDDILAVGRLVEKKGFHILIEAVRLLREAGRDVRCRIVGGGEEADHLAAQVAASGLEGTVELLGPRPQSEVMALMREAAVLACPCVVGRDGNRDGLPTVLLEAMALGTPCVATDVTGIPELVRDGETGLCVPEGDPEALAAARPASGRRGPAPRLAREARPVEREFDQHGSTPRACGRSSTRRSAAVRWRCGGRRDAHRLCHHRPRHPALRDQGRLDPCAGDAARLREAGP